MHPKSKLLGFYNYTVILTYIGMLSGFLGVILAAECKYFTAVIALMIAGFCDLFDGAVASTKERNDNERCFGIQIDSLSDLICFGVLPGVLICKMNDNKAWALCISGLYVLCALIRLAYFNVDEQVRQKTSTAPREAFLGLPVTVASLLIPLVYGAGNIFNWNVGMLLCALLFIMSILFILPFQLKKPRLLEKILLVLCGVIEILFVVFSHII